MGFVLFFTIWMGQFLVCLHLLWPAACEIPVLVWNVWLPSTVHSSTVDRSRLRRKMAQISQHTLRHDIHHIAGRPRRTASPQPGKCRKLCNKYTQVTIGSLNAYQQYHRTLPKLINTKISLWTWKCSICGMYNYSDLLFYQCPRVGAAQIWRWLRQYNFVGWRKPLDQHLE